MFSVFWYGPCDFLLEPYLLVEGCDKMSISTHIFNLKQIHGEEMVTFMQQAFSIPHLKLCMHMLC